MILDFADIGDAFRNRRKALGLTQSDLAKRLGTTQGYIAQIEQGKRELRRQTIVEIARALELEPMLVPREELPMINAARQLAASASDDLTPPLAGEKW